MKFGFLTIVLYLHPPAHFHLTVLEIASGQASSSVVEDLIHRLRPAMESILDLPARTFAGGEGEGERRERNGKRRREGRGKIARLGKPCVTYDGQGLAVSFLPFVDDGRTSGKRASGEEHSDEKEGEAWTYHHLRADAFSLASQHVEVASRYVVPSAHITVARWHAQPSDVQATLERLVRVVEEMNAHLERTADDEWEWVVGEEVGLELRKGACWYGGGGECVGRGRGVDFQGEGEG